MHAENFLSRKKFISKTQSRMKSLIIQGISKKQLSYHGYEELITIWSHTLSSKFKTQTLTLIDWSREKKSVEDEISDLDNVTTEPFVIDNSEKEPILKKEGLRIWLNVKTKKEWLKKKQEELAIILNKKFHDKEPQEVKVTGFFCTIYTTKNGLVNLLQNLEWTSIHQRARLETVSDQPTRKQKTKAAARKHGKPKIDESKKTTDKETREKD